MPDQRDNPGQSFPVLRDRPRPTSSSLAVPARRAEPICARPYPTRATVRPTPAPTRAKGNPGRQAMPRRVATSHRDRPPAPPRQRDFPLPPALPTVTTQSRARQRDYPSQSRCDFPRPPHPARASATSHAAPFPASTARQAAPGQRLPSRQTHPPHTGPLRQTAPTRTHVTSHSAPFPSPPARQPSPHPAEPTRQT